MNEELKQHVEAYKNAEKVNTVEMGGLGDGYEAIIQDLAIEIMDILQLAEPSEHQHERSKEIEKVTNYVLNNHLSDKYKGVSGEQVGAAQNLAAVFWCQGKEKAMEMIEEKDRIITIQKPEWS